MFVVYHLQSRVEIGYMEYSASLYSCSSPQIIFLLGALNHKFESLSAPSFYLCELAEQEVCSTHETMSHSYIKESSTSRFVSYWEILTGVVWLVQLLSSESRQCDCSPDLCSIDSLSSLINICSTHLSQIFSWFCVHKESRSIKVIFINP